MGAFLFTWPDGDLAQRPHKLPKVSTDQMAIVDGLDLGLHFGCGDLRDADAEGQPKARHMQAHRLPAAAW